MWFFVVFVVFFKKKYRLALGQAVLDDLPGLWWDPVGEQHLELHHEVAPLGRALGQGQPLTAQPPDSTWFDDVAARQRHHAVVKCRDVYCAAAESLEGGQEEEEGKQVSYVDVLH